MSSFIESLETRVLYRRPFVSTDTREWVAGAAENVRRRQSDVKALASDHRADLAAAAAAGKTLIAADRQALREALAAGGDAAAEAARAKLDADRTALRTRLAELRGSAREQIGEERDVLRRARQNLAEARKEYDYELANPRVARNREYYSSSGYGYGGAYQAGVSYGSSNYYGAVMTGSVSYGAGVITNNLVDVAHVPGLIAASNT